MAFMKHKLFKSLALTCVGITISLSTIFSFTNNNHIEQASANEVDYSFTLSSKPFSEDDSDATIEGKVWHLNAGVSLGWSNEKGQKMGTGTNPPRIPVLSTSAFSDSIKSITINTCGDNAVGATVSVSVGGHDYQCTSSNSLTSEPANYTFTSETSYDGLISISWNQPSNKSAIYFRSVTVTLADATFHNISANLITPQSTWHIGDELTKEDFVIKANYSSGITKTITSSNFTMTDFDGTPIAAYYLKAGTNNLYFEYNDGYNTKKCSYSINVNKYVKISSAVRMDGTYLIVSDNGGLEANVWNGTEGTTNFETTPIIDDSINADVGASIDIRFIETVDGKDTYSFKVNTGSKAGKYVNYSSGYTISFSDEPQAFYFNNSLVATTVGTGSGNPKGCFRFNNRFRMYSPSSTTGYRTYFYKLNTPYELEAVQTGTTTYHEGDILLKSDFTVTKLFTDGTTATLSESEYSFSNPKAVYGFGNTVDIVLPNGQSTACSVNVVASDKVLKSVNVNGVGDAALTFHMGDLFTFTSSSFSATFTTSSGDITEMFIDSGTIVNIPDTFKMSLGTYENSKFTPVYDDVFGKPVEIGMNGLRFRVSYTFEGVTKTKLSTPVVSVSWSQEDLEIGLKEYNGLSYHKVTDVADLQVGDRIIFAAMDNAAESSYHAMGAQNGSSNRAGTAAIGTDYSTDSRINAQDLPNDAAVFTVVAGSVDSTLAFQASNGKYLAVNVSSTGGGLLQSVNTLDEASSWTVTITDGATSIVANKYEKNVMKYNCNGTNNLFNCYASSSTYKEVSIYKYDYMTITANLLNVCKDANECLTGECSNRSVSQETWLNVKAIYESLSSEEKNMLANAQAVKNGSEVEDFLAKYDIIIAQNDKYPENHYERFIKDSSNVVRRPTIENGFGVAPKTSVQNTALTSAIIGVSIFILLFIAGFIFVKKYKPNKVKNK